LSQDPSQKQVDVNPLGSLKKEQVDISKLVEAPVSLGQNLSQNKVEVNPSSSLNKEQVDLSRLVEAPISLGQNLSQKKVEVNSLISLNKEWVGMSKLGEASFSLNQSVSAIGVSLNGQHGFTNVNGADQNNASLTAVINPLNPAKNLNENISLVQKVMAYVKKGEEGAVGAAEKLSTNNGFAAIPGVANSAESNEAKLISKDAQIKDPTTPTFQISKQVMEKLKSSAWGKQVANRALMMTQYGPRAMEINLDPPELGVLQIRVQINALDQVSISFNAQSQAVKDSIAENFDSLKDLFEEEGIDLAEASVNDDKNKENSKVSWLDENGDLKDNFNSESKNKENKKTKVGIVDVYA
jgi:flagellar hook-length control protein FliK